MGELSTELKSKENHQRFELAWTQTQSNKQKGYRKILIWILKVYRKDLCLSLIFNFTHMMFKMCTPILIKLIVDFMQEPTENDGGLGYGLWLVLGYILIDILSVLLEEQAWFYQMILGKFRLNYKFRSESQKCSHL